MVVQLVAARAATLQPRLQQVDQPLGIAQLRRGHPVEVTVTQHLTGAECVGGHDQAFHVGGQPLVVITGNWCATDVLAPESALVARFGFGGRVRVVGRGPVVAAQGPFHRFAAQAQAPPSPETVEHAVVHLAVVAPAHEHR